MKKILIFLTSLILFIELLDATILYSCLVPVAHDFGITLTRMTLPILSYVVGTCLLIPAVSWLSSRWDPWNIVVTALIIFTITSVLCGMSHTVFYFSIYRFLQGISISICSATITIILLSVCSSDEIVNAMGLINIPALFGTAIGPLCGAALSYYLSWRFAFFINVPIGILLIFILSDLKSKAQFNKVQSERFDYKGFFLVSLFLILFSIGIDGISSAENAIFFIVAIAGIIFGIFYVLLWMNRQSENEIVKVNSILNLSVFKNSDFKLGAIVNMISRASMCGIPILLGIILQQAFSFSIIKTSVYFAIIAVSGILAKLLSPFISRIGVRRVIVLSVCFTASAIVFLSALSFWIKNGNLWLICAFFGFSMSLLYTAMNSVVYLSLDSDEVSNASNIVSIIQQFSIGLGVVFAVGGFHLLLALHKIQLAFIGSAEIMSIYSIICKSLAFLMCLNLVFAIRASLNTSCIEQDKLRILAIEE